MNLRLLFLASLLLISIASPLVDAGVDPEWRTLTKQNFTSQIQLHSSILLIVTVPWCGESLSLMRDISRVITENGTGLEGLKLMRLYRNKEKTLAETLGASGDISIIHYHNYVPYKYRGRLRAANIIRSIVSMSSLEASELPLKSLGTHEELADFIESTDKAVVLLESCGWTSRLLNQDSLIRNHIEAKISYSPIFKWGGAQKVAGHKDALMCDIHKGIYDFPSYDEFSSFNGSASSSDLDDSNISPDSPCNSKNFEQFDSFCTKFINSAREMFLPLEKQRFGFVSDRSIITSLGINDSTPWSVMLHYAGCPGCNKTFQEGDDLDKFLQMDVPLVTELEDDGHRAEILLGNNPSVILFVDRSSNLSTVREASNDALKAFREVAWNYQVPYQIGHNINSLSLVESSAVDTQKKTFEHPKLELSTTSQRIKSTQKISIMIMDGEKHVSLENIASGLQISSLQQILDQIIKPTKGSKLSLVAKNAGFQLLSDDLDIQVDESVQTGKENSHYQPLPEVELTDDPKKEAMQTFPNVAGRIIFEKSSEPVTSQCSSSDCEKITNPSVQPSHSEICPSATLTDIVEWRKKRSSMDISDESSPQLKSFEGNFYFSDGGYRLLRSLTGGFKMPSLVIIDPILPAHYVIEEGDSFNKFRLVDFVDRYTNKSLGPYQRSGSSDAKPSDTSRPSHEKLDTHDIDSIPKVSAQGLSNILMSIREPYTPGSGGGWKEDVLVLFSNSWCAFCQRMELVVHEVYNSLRSYEKVLKGESKNAKSASNPNDDQHDLTLKSPRVYTIDCTTNDCSAIMASTGQSEAYPSLVLFPGNRKDVVTYDGNMEVSGIIKFLADHGSYSNHLVGEKGILWTKPDSKDNNLEVFEGSNSLNLQLETFNKPNEQFEFRLTSTTPKNPTRRKWIQSEVSEVATLPPSSKVVVGSVLVATAKLLEAYPFDQSKILIVKAEENVGYQGLILNKHINWNSFQELTKGSEKLKLAPLSLGGPVIEQEIPLVALVRKHIKDDYPEVIPGLYFLDQAATAQEINEVKSGNRPNVTDYWFFLGYSSWGWEQLHNEIADKAWKVTDVLSTHIQWPQ